MKTLLWTAAILGSSISSLAAQEESYVLVANTGSTVDVRRPWGALVRTLNAGYNFNAPYDIVAVPSAGVVVVSNSGNGTLTVINAQTFAFVQTVNLGTVGGINIRGMSLSRDETRLFVAGQHVVGPNNNPAVFQVLVAGMTPSFLGEVLPTAQLAEDCVFADVGPGRVYFSVPAANRLGIVDLGPPAAVSFMDIGVGPVSNVRTPTRLERTPDHSAIFAACTSNDVAFNSQFICRVEVNGNVPTQHALRTLAIQNLGMVLDVAFRPDGRAYVLGSVDAGAPDILEMDVDGNNLGMAPQPAGLTVPGVLRYDDNPPRLYVGDTGGTSPNYGIRYATTQPTVTLAVQAASVGGPRAFAFVVGAPLRISDVWPPGLVSAAGTTIEIRGRGFTPASTVTFRNNGTGANVARTVTFVSSDVLGVNGDGLVEGAYDVVVANPGGESFTLDRYFISLDPLTLLTPSVVTVPSRNQGYGFASVPQYLSAGDLLGAINAQFGGYNPSAIRVFLQNGGGYLELSAAPSNFDLSNKSFWIISRDGGTLTLNEFPVGAGLQGAGEDDKIMVLEPGWNMVTQPTFNPASGGGRYALNGVAVWADGALLVQAQFGASSILDTAAVGLTSMPARYQNGAYVFLSAADDMFTGIGYWIRNNTGAPLYLEFLTSDATPKGVATRTVARAVAPAVAASELPPAPPGGAIEEEEAGTSGCGLPGLELLALLGFHRFLQRRSRRKLAA